MIASGRILVFLSNIKELEVITFIITTKEELNKLKINDFSWTHQRTEIAGRTATLILGKSTSRKTRLRSAY